ncbi:MAG: TolC family protein [Tannerella sp.]|jgi:outer membrane protein TolC|nr:TolC family protein [Tannerella sp.]
MTRQILSLLLLFTPIVFTGQTKIWNLDDCIRYAVENNPQVKKQQAQNKIYSADKAESLAGFLPSVSAGTSIFSNFGRSIDPDTNIYVTRNTLSNSYDLRASMMLFDGLANIYRVKFAKINRLMGKEQLQGVKDQIALETMEIFFNALYYKGTTGLAKNQLQESIANLHKTERMEELGLKSAPDVAEIRAKEAEDRFLLTQQQNLLNQEIIKLKAKMNFPIEEAFDIADYENVILPESANEDAVKIFYNAQQTMPRLRSSEQSLKASATAHKISRGGLFPTISADAGINSNFSRFMDGGAYMPFWEQLKNKQGSYVGVTLSIPLFNRLSRISETRRAKQRFLIAQSDDEDLKRQVFSEIEQAVADVNGLSDEFVSAEKKAESMEAAHNVNVRKYEEGLIDALELSTSSNRLLNARIEALYTNLKLQLKSKLLNYYKGETSWTEF